MSALFPLVRRRAGTGLLALIVPIAVAGLSSPASAASPAPPAALAVPAAQRAPATTRAAATLATLTARVVALTNAHRRAHGCGALAVNTILTRVAQAHSADMAAHNYFSHYSRDGRSPFDRMRAAGYRYSLAAENIAAGQTTADVVVAAWMNSPPHRANILNCRLRQIGVGYGYNRASTYRTYWTQDFGTPR